ncbi:MAG: LysR family transcriptional regulator [Alphaproteobacteria bacterium]
MDYIASYRALTTVVEQGDFTSAAKQLGQSRSAVSRAVQNLEDHLQTQLLNRSTRQVKPTTAGVMVYERALEILASVRLLENDLTPSSLRSQGHLRVSVPTSFSLYRAGQSLVAFKQAYPGIHLDVMITDRMVDLVGEGVDVAMRIGKPDEDSNMVDHRLSEMPRVVCAAPDLIKEIGEPENVQDLAQFPILHYAHDITDNTWLMIENNSEAPLRVEPTIRSNNGEFLREAAIQGLGATMLPEFIVGEALKSGKLVSLLCTSPATALTLCLLHPPSRHLSTPVQLFVDFMQDWFEAS